MCSWEIYLKNKRWQEEREFQMELTGQFMALFANANRDTRTTTPFTRKDFFKLSYDTILNSEIDPDLFQKVARRLGSRIKKKDSGDK